MRDFQHAQRRLVGFREEVTLGLDADVAGEQQFHVAVPHPQHDRVVVARALPLPVGHRRIQHVHTHRANLEPITALELTPRNTAGGDDTL